MFAPQTPWHKILTTHAEKYTPLRLLNGYAITIAEIRCNRGGLLKAAFNYVEWDLIEVIE
jgi:hypothetical protein